MTTNTAEIAHAIQTLGVRVDMVEIPAAVARMENWINSEGHRSHHVVNTGMHGIMEAYKDPHLKAIFSSTDLLAPDGILMVLLARLKGFPIRKSHTGPGLLWEFSRLANQKGYSSFFYGDDERTLQLLEKKLHDEFPDLIIAGHHSPPFRDLTLEEDDAVVEAINHAKPDVVWVGLGMPKQEKWIFEHRNTIRAPIMVGAGAAFKLIGGGSSRAPSWFQNVGIEWLWRLACDPKKMWRRVLIDAPRFIALVGLELSGLKKFN